MIISENKLKGMIVFSLGLAIIPFFCLIFHSIVQYKIPVFADQCINCLAVEIVEDDQSAGVYFVPPETAVNQLLESAAVRQKSENNFQLKTGMRLVIDPNAVHQNIVADAMPSADRLPLGLPIDINKASEEDLLLIRGIGKATAQNILDLRVKLNRFEDINRLMEIKGIKERRLTEIKKYLYVGK
ncbi:MAG: helix-hairpin-helix domain-containing protein [Smithella sp.]